MEAPHFPCWWNRNVGILCTILPHVMYPYSANLPAVNVDVLPYQKETHKNLAKVFTSRWWSYTTSEMLVTVPPPPGQRPWLTWSPPFLRRFCNEWCRTRTFDLRSEEWVNVVCWACWAKIGTYFISGKDDVILAFIVVYFEWLFLIHSLLNRCNIAFL